MSLAGLKPQLKMLRPDLAVLPAVDLPAGYALRHFQPGDGPAWTRIIAESFQGQPEDYSFDGIMRADIAFRPERVWFVTRGDAPVATASAYIQPSFMAGAGMIHYVGVCGGHSGKKLGYWVTLAALHQMAREGWQASWLATDDYRLPAIKIYLNLGFVPLLVHENQRERWRAVFAQMGLSGLAEAHQAILDAAPYTPPTRPADGFDYARQVCRRRRMHPGRSPGRPQADEVDSLGDESLYRASDLGRAAVEPTSVAAGSNQGFALRFTAGAHALMAGTIVSFHTPGQAPLGTRPQAEDRSRPGYVELSGPACATIAVERLGFRIQAGALGQGDVVELRVGQSAGFTWTPLAGRKEIKVLIHEPGEPCKRLPEPLVVEILPGAGKLVQVLLPATASPGAPVDAHVTVRDAHDNPVPMAGQVRIHHGDREQTVQLARGRARVRAGSQGPGPLRLRATIGGLPAGTSNPCVPTDDLQLYIGDLHVHDLTCPAEGYPKDVYAWARDQKRLDFVSVSVQNHDHLDNDKWAISKHMAEAFLEEGRFVTFPAFEWQHSRYGDKVIHYLGGDQPYLPVDDPRTDQPAKLYEALRASDALVISHHPGYGLDTHVPGTDWAAMETDVDRLVELWSMHGSSEGVDPEDRPLVGNRRAEGVMAGLRAGKRFGFVAGSDTHSGRPGGSAKEPRPYWGGLVAVWARDLTRRSIFAALRARRTYALTQARIVLRFTVNGAAMGSEIPAADDVQIRIRSWAPGTIARVEIYRNAELLRALMPRARECHLDHEDRPPGPAFYHCRVIQDDGELAVCSPVWVG